MKKINLKPVLIGLVAAFALQFLVVNVLIKGNKNFPINHIPKVESTYGPDGRAAVASPEKYRVEISPALAWEMKKKSTGGWRTAGTVILFVIGAFVALAASGALDNHIEVLDKGMNKICFVGMAIAISCLIAAYSAAFSHNYVEITPEVYQAVKDSPEKLAELFTSRPLLK